MQFITDNMQVLIAAGVVLLLLLIVLSVWRAVSPRISGRRGQRLGISEYYELDKTRRLVLVRRDNVEHLVLIGGPQDIVIESGVTAASIAASYAAPIPQVETGPVTPPVRPAPRPPVFGDRKAPPLRTIEPAPPPRPRETDPE